MTRLARVIRRQFGTSLSADCICRHAPPMSVSAIPALVPGCFRGGAVRLASLWLASLWLASLWLASRTAAAVWHAARE